MESAHVSRLKEEQEKSLAETLEQFTKWETFGKDYKALRERLETLPDKVSHNTMVPFGPVAFMPGTLVHTNEIMVLLGENWFVERSAKQACEIIDRRTEHVKSMLSDLAKQRHLLETRLSFTTELKDMSENRGDLVDIREEYDPEREAQWREQRKTKTTARSSKSELERGSRQKPQPPPNDEVMPTKTPVADGLSNSDPSLPECSPTEAKGPPTEPGESLPERNNDSPKEEPKSMNEEQLWARLDELERREEEMDELAMVSEEEMAEDTGDTAIPNKVVKKQVSWEGQPHPEPRPKPHPEPHPKPPEEKSSSSQYKPVEITFKHTTTEDKLSNQIASKCFNPDVQVAINNPADIYDQYLTVSAHNPREPEEPKTEMAHQPLRSILKAGTSSNPVDGTAAVEPDETLSCKILPAPKSAFSGEVTERSDISANANEDTTTVALSKDKPTTPKRVSRFKAARQQQR